MELRARTRTLPRRAATTAAALAVLLASAFAGAIASPADAKTSKPPVVKKISPMTVSVGQTLTMRGRGFVRGRKKTTVVFKRDGARAVFVKADLSTAKLLKVTVPDTLSKYFRKSDGQPVATRFRVRVLGRRLGRRYTSVKRSPFIGPVPQQAAADGDCDGDGTKNGADTDDDNDLLADTFETQIHTDPCKLDSDGDGVEDGYEYESALNLNDDEFQERNTDLFYPAKLPYANPLYAGDANTDFDGDSLTLAEEQALWKYTYEVGRTAGRTVTPLSYSDGRQRSESIPAGGYAKHTAFVDWLNANGYRSVVLQNRGWVTPTFLPTGSAQYGIFDTDRDRSESLLELDSSSGLGLLRDDQRDEDADGLSNYDELHGRMLVSYWSTCYAAEPAFHIAYAGTDVVDADSDGDGILDGADDQDHDDVPNLMELSRVAADGGTNDSVGHLACNPPPTPPRSEHDFGRVNPFNPCLPDTDSRTCPRYYNSTTGAPFYTDGDKWSALQ